MFAWIFAEKKYKNILCGIIWKTLQNQDQPKLIRLVILYKYENPEIKRSNLSIVDK